MHWPFFFGIEYSLNIYRDKFFNAPFSYRGAVVGEG